MSLLISCVFVYLKNSLTTERVEQSGISTLCVFIMDTTGLNRTKQFILYYQMNGFSVSMFLMCFFGYGFRLAWSWDVKKCFLNITTGMYFNKLIKYVNALILLLYSHLFVLLQILHENDNLYSAELTSNKLPLHLRIFFYSNIFVYNYNKNLRPKSFLVLCHLLKIVLLWMWKMFLIKLSIRKNISVSLCSSGLNWKIKRV